MVKVSIIIPAYNVEQYITRGIESAIYQTESDIEIIIVDDGSTDGTWNIIQRYAALDGRIKTFHQDNAGVSAARNKALELAIGEYILFLDSDDWLELETVEVLLNNADSSDKVLVCSECYFVDISKDGKLVLEQQGKGITNKEFSKEDSLLYVGRRSPLKLQSSCYKLFQRTVINEATLRFNTSIFQGEDGLFTFEYLLNIDRVKYISAPLWNILNRPGSACNSGYTKKWLTSIDAINRMLDYKNGLSDRIIHNLFAFRAERAMWIEIECLRVKNSDMKDAEYAREILKTDYQYLIARRSNFKLKIQCLLLRYCPIILLRPLLRFTK